MTYIKRFSVSNRFHPTLKKICIDLFSADLRSLAFLRVGIASIILLDLLIRSQDIVAHYTDFGIMPRSVLVTNSSSFYFSLHFMSGNGYFQAALMIIAAIFACMLLVGYRTKIATIVSWILLISLQNRNGIILQGDDNLLRVLLFWGMFLPWGARYSVDSTFNERLKNLPNRVISMGILGYLLQVVIVYFAAFQYKYAPAWRSEYSAVYYALHLDQFATPLAYILREIDWLLPIITFMTIWFEGFGPLLLFIPIFTPFFRTIGVFSFIFMHASFGLNMMIGIFPLVSIASFLGYLPTQFWDILLNRLKTKKRTDLEIYYDNECGFCRKVVHLIKTFLLLPQVKVLPAMANTKVQKMMDEYNSWVIIDHQKKYHIKADGFYTMLEASPLLFFLAPILRMFKIFKIDDRIYDLVSHRRKLICPLRPPMKETSTFHFEFSLLGNLLAYFFLMYVLFWNIANLPYSSFKFPTNLIWISQLTRLDQRWDMFSPYPLMDDGWYVIPAVLTNGKTVDLMNGGKEVTYEKPEMVAKTYKNFRWRKQFLNLWSSAYSESRSFLLNYLCRDWNLRHNSDQKAQKVTLQFMLERTPPPGKPFSPPQLTTLSEVSCQIY